MLLLIKSTTEASIDMWWGCGRRLYSEEQMEGNWNGLNKLGELLMEVQEDLGRRVFEYIL